MKLFKRVLNINKMIKEKKININFIGASTMKGIDDELMGKEYNYTLEQLMELAGQSVALSIYDCILNENSWKSVKKVLTIVGPGSK